MDGLYERDALAWAEQQADLLRRLSNGEPVNAEIDWDHVIDEALARRGRESPGPSQDGCSPAMRSRIDLEKLYRRARRLAMASASACITTGVPAECPFMPDDLLQGDLDPQIRRLAG